MNKAAIAIVTGTFLALAGPAFANDTTNAVKHPVETTKAKVAAEKTEDRMENNADAQYKAAKKEAEGTYKAAKERCKEMKGAEERACKKQAKAEYDTAVKEAKATHAKAKGDAKAAGAMHKAS